MFNIFGRKNSKMIYPTSIKSKKYPSFIRGDENLLKLKEINKVFPRIGMENCSKTIRHNGVYKVVFSSHHWDIATMSMRGIESCMSWEGGYGNGRHLIGSIIDPCVAIIYIEDKDTTRYGTSMVARSVVRFVFNKRTKRRAIFLEYPYASDSVFKKWETEFDAGANKRYKGSRDRYSYETKQVENIKEVFVKFISSMTKYKVIPKGKGYNIPLSKEVQELPREQRSYIDSCIPYSKKIVFHMKDYRK